MLKLVSGTVLGFIVLSAAACAPAPPRADAPASSARPPDLPTNVETSATVALQSGDRGCTDTAFVACPSSEACAMRAGELIEPQKCFVRAADACRSARCEHGCDIHHGAVGEPETVHCSANAQSSSNMQRCGGYSGWGCPEQMTCQLTSPHSFDVEGICVPTR